MTLTQHKVSKMTLEELRMNSKMTLTQHRIIKMTRKQQRRNWKQLREKIIRKQQKHSNFQTGKIKHKKHNFQTEKSHHNKLSFQTDKKQLIKHKNFQLGKNHRKKENSSQTDKIHRKKENSFQQGKSQHKKIHSFRQGKIHPKSAQGPLKNQKWSLLWCQMMINPKKQRIQTLRKRPQNHNLKVSLHRNHLHFKIKKKSVHKIN